MKYNVLTIPPFDRQMKRSIRASFNLVWTLPRHSGASRNLDVRRYVRSLDSGFRRNDQEHVQTNLKPALAAPPCGEPRASRFFVSSAALLLHHKIDHLAANDNLFHNRLARQQFRDLFVGKSKLLHC